MPISESDLAAIRKRATAATAGPWYWGPEHPEFSDVLGEADFVVSGETPLMQFEPSRNGAADAEFVAYARQDVPALLAIAEAAHAYVTFPERPEVPDPNDAHSWDMECERRYYALRALVIGDQGNSATCPYATGPEVAP